jgi:hypothetical protein
MALETTTANTRVVIKLGPVFFFFLFERDTFSWKVVLVLFLSPLAILHFPFHFLFPFSLYLLTFPFLRTLTENGGRVAVHVCTEHHMGARIDSQLWLAVNSELWQQGMVTFSMAGMGFMGFS